ncbi:MAG TPA: hypothetical protein VE910_04460 [Dongiaceae bacterium]|jgi:hypothetical protein|nr:hypothetical protein [Dongiaceae bacterium]
MVSIPALWLPIVLSAVLVFVVSSIVHMLLPYHRKDFLRLPDEDAVRAVLGRQSLGRGQYFMPFAPDMKAMKDPEMAKKFEEGPVAIVTVLKRGHMNMGPHLIKWFAFLLGMSFTVAYLLSRTLPPQTVFMQVFRVASTISWLGYAGALIWSGIWKGVPWSTVLKDVLDGLIFALVTGAAFAGFWPK